MHKQHIYTINLAMSSIMAYHTVFISRQTWHAHNVAPVDVLQGFDRIGGWPNIIDMEGSLSENKKETVIDIK